jgi:4-hydroxythreonine-4-phosphate dehydrogenase
MTAGSQQLLALSPGEPAGIGPECLLKLVAAGKAGPLVAVACPELLQHTASRLGLPVRIRPWQPGAALPATAGELACLPVPLAAKARPGQLDTRNAPYVLDCLRRATALVQEGHAHALVTAPVHKGIINDAGIAFSGHTEFLAALAGVPRVVMMLAADRLRVALVTTHLPLRAVPDAITGEAVEQTIRITLEGLRQRFGIARPRVQVLGLNPHAGEGGHLGHEDDDIIAPAIERCRQGTAGAELLGPVPADAAFTPTALRHCDAVIAMYHDQGLPVLKHAGFGRAINLTLGLPFIRTSVDHGTALDIADQGVADPSSLYQAMVAARAMQLA